jgi:hypothetical protein
MRTRKTSPCKPEHAPTGDEGPGEQELNITSQKSEHPLKALNGPAR